MTSGWTQTKIVLGGFVDLLACGKCKKTPEMPMRYVNCGHFFCDTCIFGQTTCFQCQIPVKPNDILPDRMVSQLLEYCNVIISVITKNNSEDLKSLAKAVHQFSAECNGVVPETDSDSEDEVVESSPPGGRSRERNEKEIAEMENSKQSHCKEFFQPEGESKSLEPETKGFVSPTQLSPHQRKKISVPETKGFVSPTQFSLHQRKKISVPETKGFVSPTQFSPRQKTKIGQPETKGFVSPSQNSLHQKQRNVEPETGGFVDQRGFSRHQRKVDGHLEPEGILDQTEFSPCQKRQNLQPETAGFVSPTQFSPRQKRQNLQPETAGFVSPTQFSPRRKRQNLQPETAGFVSPTQFSPRRKRQNLQTETAGFVSPTQFSPRQKRQNLQPETAGFVDPTQLSPRRRKKNPEPETAGFVDPTQLSPRQRKKNPETETAGFVDPTQLSPRRRKKNPEPETAGFGNPRQRRQNLQPETAGFVSPTQFSPRKKRQNLQPETAGFVDPTQFSPRQKRQNLQPETAGFVDPTQLSPRRRKNDLQPESTEFLDSIDREKNGVEDKLQAETVGYLDKTLTPPGRKKKGLSIKTRKILSRVSCNEDKNKNSIIESRKSEDPGFSNKKSLGKLGDPVQKKKTLERNATLTESTDFVDATQFEKDGAINLQPETEGFRDPSQSPVQPEKKKLSRSSTRLNSKPIDQHLKNIETKANNDDSSEEMDWIEERVDGEKKLHQCNEDPILAAESVDMEQTICRNDIIPETLRNVENLTNYQNVPMEIEHDIVEGSILSKDPRPQNSQDKTANKDSNKRTISKVEDDDSMENLELGGESPVEQFKRIKSLALNRRKIRKITQDLDSSVETFEAGQKSSKEKAKNDENVVLDRCKKMLCQQDSIVVRAEDKMREKVDEIVEKTPAKRSTRTRSLSKNKEEQKMSLSGSSATSEISGREKRATRQKSTKGSSRDERSLEENEKIDSNEAEESATSRQIRGEPTLRLGSRENLDKENLDATSKKNVKNKSADPKARHNVDKSKTAVPRSIPKNVNKRNAKGETLLHTACVKGQEDYVKILLEAGANPNTKDNANWTPLQEAVNLGHREICKMLLQAGASPNTPAMDNRTALHDAAANDKLEEAALLLRFNANKNVYDKFGKRPINYAVSDEMRDLLAEDTEIVKSIDNDPCGDSALDQSIIIPNSKVIVLPSNLNNKNRKLLAQLASKLKVEVAMTFRPTVTHVVVETNDRNITELTYNVMLAILQGKWILNSQWITISTDLNDISEIDLELFEVHGAPNPETPTRARINEEKQNPRLFNNCYFYFAIGPRCTWSYEKFEFTKESLTTLVLGGQGEILHREPDPEDVKDYKLTPFHVAHKPIHPLYKCSHYIIYMPGKDEPRVKYNMPHIKSLPVGWFLECIEKFTLVDPLLMGIS